MASFLWAPELLTGVIAAEDTVHPAWGFALLLLLYLQALITIPEDLALTIYTPLLIQCCTYLDLLNVSEHNSASPKVIRGHNNFPLQDWKRGGNQVGAQDP